jgi:hypothetical protein
MGWFRHATAKFKRRIAITVDNSAAAAAVTLDVDTTIPKDWEDFWSVIDSAGDKIRVTGPDGVTLVSYDIDDGSGGTFNAAAITARTGRIRVDGMTIPTATAGMFLLWLYFDPDSTVADASSAVVMASIGTGHIDHALPRGPWRVFYQPQTPLAQGPRDRKHKAPAEQVEVYFNLDRALERHQVASAGSLRREEPYYLTMSVLDTSAADQTGMYSLAACRFVWVGGPGGQMWVKTLVKSGTTGNRYTAVATVHTVVPFAPTAIYQTLQPRLGLAVRSTIES